MPPWSKDIQYGAAAGFVIIVGVIAMQFGFSAKLVLALLAGVGTLFCASQFDGLPRAAMIGASIVLLLLVAYNLATTCDSACQQSRAEAAQQRAAQEQLKLSASQPQSDPTCDWSAHQITLGPDWAEVNPRPFNCKMDLFYSEQEVSLWVKIATDNEAHGPYGRGQQFPRDVQWVKSEGKTFPAFVRLSPATR